MLLKGKKGLIMGVANDKSIAWAVAKACKDYGAEQIAISYQGDLLKKRVEPLAETIEADLFECDVTSDSSIETLVKKIKEKYGTIDFILHSIAFANKDNLKSEYYNVKREDFHLAFDVSVYSFTAIVQKFVDILNPGASIVTMTYHGSQKVVTNYNVMGVAKAALESSVMYLANDCGKNNIRVNSISAGPVRTLASSAIGGFKSILSITEKTSPLKRNVEVDEVAKTAIYLFSDLASAVTGENIYVDCGLNIIATAATE
jgi:enoyl-[acyl-carrier protein] reductase I